jgi:dTDP-glucose 4,6-dehydratase/UDP-glucose 4-epimerase
MKNVLITGAKGFIGRNVAKHFKSKLYNVIGIDKEKWPEHQSKPYGIDIYIESDIDVPILKTLSIRFDLIIHCAGGSSVNYSFQNPQDDYNATVLSLVNTLEYMRLYNPSANLIYLSSAAVYGNPSTLPVSEDAPLNPLSPYGWNKLHAENLCKEYIALYNLKIAILRIFSTYGPGLRKQIFWDIYNKSLQNKSLQFFGSGIETRDFIYIDDLVGLIAQISEQANFTNNIYNCANGEQVTIKYIVTTLLKELEFEHDYGFNNETRLGDPIHWEANIKKIIDLGYKQNVSIENGITLLSNWFKNLDR